MNTDFVLKDLSDKDSKFSLDFIVSVADNVIRYFNYEGLLVIVSEQTSVSSENITIQVENTIYSFLNKDNYVDIVKHLVDNAKKNGTVGTHDNYINNIKFKNGFMITEDVAGYNAYHYDKKTHYSFKSKETLLNFVG